MLNEALSKLARFAAATAVDGVIRQGRKELGSIQFDTLRKKKHYKNSEQ